MNRNLHLEHKTFHKTFHAETCVFTAPQAHCIHAYITQLYMCISIQYAHKPIKHLITQCKLLLLMEKKYPETTTSSLVCKSNGGMWERGRIRDRDRE